MKKFYLSFSLILVAAFACIAQSASTSSRTTGSGDSKIQGGQVFSSAANAAVEAQLQKSIDVKKAKVGDEVILKTTRSIKENGETIIPKGTNLIGRVTEVQQRTKDNGMSKIGMIFDRIENKSLAAPITASIISITSAQAATSVGDSFGSGVSGSSQTSGSGSTSGGGLLGGVGSTVGSTVGGVTNTVGGVANSATQTVGTVANTAGQTIGSTAGTVGQTFNGIQISNSISGSASGSTTLLSPNKNFKLEKGVVFQMQVSGQSASAIQPGN
ncbi:MAG: hypothetical protein ABIU09_09485 [Pyrinomonadaceae bacterium]